MKHPRPSRGASWTAALLTLTGLAGLTGCQVDQRAEIATYRQVLDGDQPAPTEPLDPDAPLGLRRAMRLAVATSESLAIRGETYLQALIDKDRATARFLPTVSFAPTFTRQDETNLGGEDSLVSQFVPTSSLDLPVQAGLDVNPMRDLANVDRAQASAAARKADLLSAKADVLLDVAATYYQVLRSQRQVAVLENSQAVQDQRLTDVRARRAAGAALPLDVAQVQGQLAQTRASLIQARRDVDNGRSTLAFLVGAPAVRGPLADDVVVPEGIPSIASLIDLAYAHRQDLQSAEAQVVAATQGLESAWGGYFPSVSLDLEYFLSRESFPPDVDWLGVLKVRVPLFTAGLVHADVRTAWSRLRQARLNLSLVQRQIREQLEVARKNLTASEQRLTELQVQVDATQESLDRSESAYAAGLATNIDRLVAQDQLLEAQLEHASEQLNRKLMYLRLQRAAGQLVEAPAMAARE